MAKKTKEFDDQLLDSLIQDCTESGDVFGDTFQDTPFFG